MIDIHKLPAIPGLSFRHFQGDSEYAQIARVLTASEAADHVERLVTADDIAKAFQHLTNCDPHHDMFIASIDNKLVGYVRGWWWDESPEMRIYEHNGFVIPEWRRKSIGGALLSWVEKRLGEVARSHPPELVKAFQVNVSQYKTGLAILLECSGYQPVRYYDEMVRPTLDDILDFPLPAGIEVRPVSPEHYPAVWDCLDETSQEEWGHNKLTDEEYRAWLSSPTFQPDLWQIAWDISTEQVVGEVLTYINHAENKQFDRLRGYTEGIGVRKSWRMRGLASALISLSLRAQKAAGMHESALVVDTGNASNATRLYERCGFQIFKRDTLFRKPLVI